MALIPSKMGSLNIRTMLKQLQRSETASRAELAKLTHMSAPTVGKIADMLLNLGIVEEVELDRIGLSNGDSTAPNRLGRPGRMLRLDRSTPRFLCIEVGTSCTSLALLPIGVSWEDQWTHQFKTPASVSDWRDRLGSTVARMKQGDSWGVLISMPGIVDEQAGRVLFSPNLRWTETADIPALIRQVWNAPIALVQEERALTLGHQCFDPKPDDFLLVDVGEGVGGAAIVSGRLYATPLSISGELGHTPVLGNKRLCGCGAVGCIETLLSTGGLMRSFTEAGIKADATWPALLQHVAQHGIEAWLEETLNAAASIIAGALNVMGVRRVIITGSLTELGPAIMEYLSAAILKGTMWARFGRVEIEIAARRRMVGLVTAGIDRLVLPKVALKKNTESIASAHAVSDVY